MPRPLLSRKIETPPVMGGFMPFGMSAFELKTIILHFDEYESIRLINYYNLSQEAAAAKMGISRPTITRLYNKAIKKIAQAFVECKAIKIEGSSVEFNNQWYKCTKCFKLIEGLENHKKCTGCESFGDKELIKFNK